MGWRSWQDLVPAYRLLTTSNAHHAVSSWIWTSHQPHSVTSAQITRLGFFNTSSRHKSQACIYTKWKVPSHVLSIYFHLLTHFTNCKCIEACLYSESSQRGNLHQSLVHMTTSIACDDINRLWWRQSLVHVTISIAFDDFNHLWRHQSLVTTSIACDDISRFYTLTYHRL